jgi:hypothetical protein
MGVRHQEAAIFLFRSSTYAGNAIQAVQIVALFFQSIATFGAIYSLPLKVPNVQASTLVISKVLIQGGFMVKKLFLSLLLLWQLHHYAELL